MRLGVATICPHYFFEERWWSYAPFVLEMNVWGQLFEEIVLAAPTSQGAPPRFWAPYETPAKISMVSYRKNHLYGLEQEPTSVFELPTMIAAITKAALMSDAFHVRSPGSIGLVSSVLVPLLRKRRCAKYAGQWVGYPGEPLSVRLQRAILASRWWGAPVTVYGNWPNQPRHIIPFFTSVLTASQIERARSASNHRKHGENLQVLFVGRLSKAKNVDVLLRSVAQLGSEGINLKCVVVGEGEQSAALESLANDLGLGNAAEFVGNVDFEEVLGFYERSDVLVLLSESEGWPKAITEAMAFGLVCIGSNRGLVPELLADGRGLVLPPGQVELLSESLRSIASNWESYQSMRFAAAAWSQRYSIETMRDALIDLLSKHWGTPVGMQRLKLHAETSTKRRR